MVSLWPFRADSSAATFEKALSTLATKIERTSAKIDTLRRRSHRVKAMWTLYTTFAYIFALLILVLVVGWENWQIDEYGAVIGSPFVIFGIRYALSVYYSYRISSAEAYLKIIVKERDDTIEKLKAATKYNSIKQLVEKYGDEPSRRPSINRAPSSSSGKKRKSGGDMSSNNTRRTGFKPPPTANIPVNRPPQQQPVMPEHQQQLMSRHPDQLRSLSSSPYPSSLSSSSPQLNSASIPPNLNHGTKPQYPATSFPSSSSSSTAHLTPRWYDRILDVLLGEDETQPKNRLALICMSCRLVNGQAPPGTRQLSDVGRWRCGGCGSWNGVESEAKSLVNQIRQDAKGNEDASERTRMRRMEEDADIHSNGGTNHSDASSDDGGDDDDDDDDNDNVHAYANTHADAPHNPEARASVSAKPDSENERTSEPEAEVLRGSSDNGAISTGRSKGLGQKETPPAQSTRSARKRNKR